MRRSTHRNVAAPTSVDELDLDDLEAVRKYTNRKTVVYKLVDTFAGITKRRIWLKDGNPPRTDGHEIVVPLNDSSAYRLTEHELSHILFRSDSRAKDAFLTEYSGKIQQVAKKEGVAIPEFGLKMLLAHFIGVLEDHRVDSLWGLLYEGSAKLKKEMDRELIQEVCPNPHESLVGLMAHVEAGLPIPSGALDRYLPYFREAVTKVERRGMEASLVVTKWLVTQLVTEIVRFFRDLPPPQSQPQDGGQDQDQGEGDLQPQGGSGGVGGAGDQDGADGMGGDGSQGNGDHMVAESGSSGAGNTEVQDGQQSGKQQRTSGEGGRRKFQPPNDLQALSAKERAEALKKLVDENGAAPAPPQMRGGTEELQPSKYPARGEEFRAKKMAQDALKTDVGNEQKLEEELEASSQQMKDLIEEARQAMRKQMTNEEWLRKDALAKVVFKDVKSRDVENQRVPPLSQDDQDTVRRLRAVFNRVMGRRKVMLDDAGTEIDVPAYIEYLMSGQSVPCFKHEEMGRGFKAMILLDRSGSMTGSKTDQAERACRIISRALRYPFVDLTIWGFQSLEHGQVDIARFDPRLEIFDSEKSSIGGCTPLHVAVRLGARHMERGAESKALFPITDGFPVYGRRDGGNFGTKQLMLWVREEVQKARADGINVTGVLIGNDMEMKDLAFMFGSSNSWKRMRTERFGAGLVDLVSRSFIGYLKSR